MCSPDTHPAPCTATPIGPIVSTSYASDQRRTTRSEEHTSELQSRLHLVCRLLLETKKPGAKTRPTASDGSQTAKHCCWIEAHLIGPVSVAVVLLGDAGVTLGLYK